MLRTSAESDPLDEGVCNPVSGDLFSLTPNAWQFEEEVMFVMMRSSKEDFGR
jgi:hypothetical protein